MKYDCVVIGGGPIGAMAAMTFKKRFNKVALIEQRPLEKILQAKISKTLALNYKSLKILNKFGFLESLESTIEPILQVQVSTQNHAGVTRMKANQLSLSKLGGTIFQHHLESKLYAQLLKQDIHIIDAGSLTSLTRHSDYWKILYQQGLKTFEIHASICIGSDGQDSKTRQSLGIDVKRRDYQQTAMVSMIEISREHHNIAYEHFCDQGAVALLPMKGNYATCIWTVPTIDAFYIEKFTDIEFINAMTDQFKKLLSFSPKCVFRKSFKLTQQIAHTQATKHALLLGNAAHSLHPIAAQGLNLSLRDLDWIATQLNQEDMGCESIFHKYEKARQDDQAQMLRYTHLMASKLATHHVPNWAKSLALSFIDSLPGAKRYLSQLNLGVEG